MIEPKRLTPEELARLNAIVAKAQEQRTQNEHGPNYGEVVETPQGVAFVTLDPMPCDGHDIDDEWMCCRKCGLSIWRMGDE
ncbi:hypothetical protein [Pigmentiphaga sp. CHJ604]|uniref:hypothetical protein n=1 Tax=Pigmentiphaga sp. CHJ604 TaxID=3081984 RepID=UPI0030D42513